MDSGEKLVLARMDPAIIERKERNFQKKKENISKMDPYTFLLSR